MKTLNFKKCFYIIGILVFMILTAIALIFLKHINNNPQDIKLKFSNDFTYFDNKMEDFASILINDLNDNSIRVVSNSKYHGDDWADLYRYDIKLDNGDIIYLTSQKDGIIQRIIYRGNINDTKYTGKFIGTISRLFIKNLDAVSFENEINNTFLTEENLSKMFGDSYVYSHIKFEWFRSSDDSFYHLTFSVVPEENQTQHKEKLEKEEKEQEEKEKQEAEAEALKKIEEAKKIAEKERTFTAGTYKVGRDIEEGTYNMIALSGRGNCFVDSTSTVIETFTPGGSKYAIDRYNNVELSYGGIIEVTSTLKIKFEPVN